MDSEVPELLLPAGGFDSALAAIAGGADALYLGFSEFSARKQARNFDRLEYRRLHRHARKNEVKLYITLNTIILDREIESVASLLAFLGRFPPDAVLVQDWGLAALIRERHPGIAIHASTQAGVQGSAAVGIARKLGAARIVLPRETSLAEMKLLREEEPDMEYEVFVHGALCYSFSGLCLASGLVLGRSGNRGECAQLCRSYYEAEGLPNRGYWFSCRDLDLGERVGELAAAGIRSLKVEGRMKSPEYCYAVASLYRGLIDRLGGEGPDEMEIARRRDAARTAFARAPTEGWLFERGGSALIDADYPGHRGLSAGRILRSTGSRMTLELSTDLGIRDGLLGFEGGDPSRPLRFPALGLRDPSSGRELVRAKAGSRLEIDVPLESGRPSRFKPGEELFRISAREQDLRTPSPEEYEEEREELRLMLRIEGGEIGSGLRMGAELEMPLFEGWGKRRSGSGQYAAIEAGEALPFDRAKNAGGFERALGVFSQSGDADFRLKPDMEWAALIELPPGPSSEPRFCPAADLFLPPSILKREKNRIYARAARLLAEAELSYALASAAMRKGPDAAAGVHGRGMEDVPPRAALVFPRPGLTSGMPFAARRDLIEGRALPAWGGALWLPLAPLVADREDYARLIRARLRRELDAGNSVLVGLGALHHFALAGELSADSPGSGGKLAFFLDFNLYVANRLAYDSLAAILPGLRFAYRYIESDQPLFAPIGPGFEAPLFQSLGCLLKRHVLGGSCPDDCARSWSTALSDRDRRYRIIVEDCVTMLFRTSGPGSLSA